MFNIINDNILNSNKNIICQQVNCMGKMGAGLAKQIVKLYPNILSEYQNYINKQSLFNCLGKCFLYKIDINKYIANLFGQHYYGNNGIYTNYNALNKALLELKQFAIKYDYSIAIPFNIGCGLAGGNWNIVYQIIQDVFNDYNNITIYKI